MLKHCRPDILARGHLSLLHRLLIRRFVKFFTITHPSSVSRYMVGSALSHLYIVLLLAHFNVDGHWTYFTNNDALFEYGYIICFILAFVCKAVKQSMLQFNFWKNNLSKLNGRNIFQSHRCTKIVYSDASQDSQVTRSIL